MFGKGGFLVDFCVCVRHNSVPIWLYYDKTSKIRNIKLFPCGESFYSKRSAVKASYFPSAGMNITVMRDLRGENERETLRILA